jgi:hypothetical protein
MNAALRKEVRLLMPAWVAALLAATVPVWVMGADVDVMEQMSQIFFAGGALLLSLSSFGLEMSFGTFPSLLAQPRPRLATWQLKIGLLLAALALVMSAAGFSWWLRIHSLSTIGVPLTNLNEAYLRFGQGDSVDHIRFHWPAQMGGLSLLAVMAFAGGLWTTILFRQTVVAFWFAILVPLVLYGAFLPLIERLSEPDDRSFVMAVIAIGACGYAAAGYGLARWLFLRAQDKQPQEATGTATWSFLPAFATPGRPVPVVALLVKELRLQQGTLVIACVLVLLHLAALAVPQYFPSLATKYAFLGDIWMVWWVAPLLVGCASVAEERRGRTLESALCLPVGKLCQFTIKLCVVFALGILLGAVLPCLFEHLRAAAKLDHSLLTIFGLPRLLLIAAVLTAIGCYASSLSGSLLHALGAAIGLCVLSPLALQPLGQDSEPADFVRGFVRFLLITAFFFLSFSNFKQLRITRRQSLGNGLSLLAVLLAAPISKFIANGIPNFFYYWKNVL